MWICFNDAFISIVQDETRFERFVVRARKKEHLEVLFHDYKKAIIASYTSDYRYRLFLDKKVVKEVLVERLMDIEYPNFKNSVEDEDLHKLYEKF